ncbi:serine/threonine-protein kinase [Pseudofrankia sp. BMG5.36]|uniref:serine/threonine-protein kinase n=1 Tax=Pseudofrankia sp. BMG5.36 TaxID=1834512 RepID=UPI0008DADE16|nr:serine/threonine-protein kinase [Pseudofrankia sp. BMG5.36]OHV65271.1 hypothetical protein BCD48_04005 [Pseudofrankia sp. BMG5.36]
MADSATSVSAGWRRFPPAGYAPTKAANLPAEAGGIRGGHVQPLLPVDPPRIGRYRLAGRIGAGGMGRVYLAYSAGGLAVALKVIHPHLAGNREFRSRFRREVAAARAVSGAFTAALVDADPDGPVPWLATEFIPGVSLHEAVTTHGSLPGPAVRSLGAALAEALAAIHAAGVIHRDLKPTNIMLGVDGPRVIDFGIAHPSESTVLTRKGATIGSPGFMAPEQVSVGNPPVGPAADVFALGAVLIYAATGESPFGRGSAAVLLYRVIHEEPRLNRLTDPALTALIATCLNRAPASRPTPEQLLEALSATGSLSANESGRGAEEGSEPTGAAAADEGEDEGEGADGTTWLPAPVTAEITRRLASVPEPPPPLRRSFTLPLLPALSDLPYFLGAARNLLVWLVFVAATGGFLALVAALVYFGFGWDKRDTPPSLCGLVTATDLGQAGSAGAGYLESWDVSPDAEPQIDGGCGYRVTFSVRPQPNDPFGATKVLPGVLIARYAEDDRLTGDPNLYPVRGAPARRDGSVVEVLTSAGRIDVQIVASEELFAVDDFESIATRIAQVFAPTSP